VNTMSGGIQQIKSVGKGTVTNLNGGVQAVASGGTSKNTKVNSGGTMTVADGAFVSGGTIAQGGIMDISGSFTAGNFISNRKDIGVTVQSGGIQVCHNDAAMKAADKCSTLEAGAEQHVASGATISDKQVKDGVLLVISSGAAATGTVVNSGGQQKIESGGQATSTTVNAGGLQMVASGGTAVGTTVSSGGRQTVASGGTVQSATIQSGGFQKVAEGGKAENNTIESGGIQEIDINGTLEGGTVDAGGLQNVINGGSAKGVTINSGGQQTVASGGNSYETHIKDGGLQTVANGGTAKFSHISAGGLQVVSSGGYARGTSVFSGGQQNVSNGGTAVNTQVLSGGTQTVASGGTAKDSGEGHGKVDGGVQNIENGGMVIGYTISGGNQNIANGGVASATTISGGTQSIANGGRAVSTTINGGSQYVSGGGVSEHATLTAGEVSIDDGGTAQFDAVTGGDLRLLYNGEATAIFGNVGGTVQSDFSLTSLHSLQDTVVLGQGDAASYSYIGNTLTVGTMTGTGANFVLNTDLANNKADKITLTNASDLANTIEVNYDPSAGGGSDIASSDPAGTLVATVTTGNATFTGKESDIGGYTYKPELSSVTAGSGSKWYLNKLAVVGNSRSMYAALANAEQMLGYWRTGDDTAHNRMRALRKDTERGIWAEFTRGSQSAGEDGHEASGTYNRYTVGYDKDINDRWTAGASFSYQHGSESYEGGNGNHDMGQLSLYGLYQDGRDNFLQLNARAGENVSDFSVTSKSGGTTSSTKDRISRWGYGLSATYGHSLRLNERSTLTPYAGLSWSRLQGKGFGLSDGSAARVYGADSFLMKVGTEWKLQLKDKGQLYAGLAFVHDFAGEGMASVSKGRTNTLSRSMQDSWLEFNAGYQYSIKDTTLWAEAGLQAGGAEVDRSWQYRLGVSFGF